MNSAIILDCRRLSCPWSQSSPLYRSIAVLAPVLAPVLAHSLRSLLAPMPDSGAVLICHTAPYVVRIGPAGRSHPWQADYMVLIGPATFSVSYVRKVLAPLLRSLGPGPHSNNRSARSSRRIERSNSTQELIVWEIIQESILSNIM